MNLQLFFMFHQFSDMDPDPYPKPLSYGSGSGKSYGSLRIRIHNTENTGYFNLFTCIFFFSKLNSTDTIFILAFAIILLNTDLHTPNLKPEKRMKERGIMVLYCFNCLISGISNICKKIFYFRGRGSPMLLSVQIFLKEKYLT
jgi:Sec7 domain